MLKLLAQLRLKLESEGGWNRDGWAGMRPIFAFDNELLTSEIYSLDNSAWLIRGVYHNVQINLPFGENYSNRITPGIKFKLQDGSRIIGEGEVIAVEN